MKVIQINSECGRGSTGKIAVAISNCLTEKGIDNCIFYSGNHKSTYPLSKMIAKKYSIRSHQILSRIFGDQGFHSSLETRRLIRWIKEYQPDVILLHNLHGYYLHLGVLFRFLGEYGKPVIWTLHDCWSFTGHCAHFTLENCMKWKTGCHSCGMKHKYPYSWFVDRSSDLYRKKKELFALPENLTLVTPSDWLADLVKQSFLKTRRVCVIHNGINLDVFSPTDSDFRKQYGLEGKIILLGVASEWSNYKGLDVFIDLYRCLDPIKYQIVLVGTSEKTDKLLPDGILSIHRTQNQAQLAAIYSAADVFVNPTKEDTYPTVNMEAIACGTPVVTFDTGGCSETVNDITGRIVHSNSIEELLERIDEVLCSESMNTEVIASVAGRFDERVCFSKYIDLISTGRLT